MPGRRYRRNFSKRPRSFAQETTVFCPSDHGLLPNRPRSFLLLMPIPGTGPGQRPCSGQGGSVSPTATDDRRHSWKSPARARDRRSPGGTSIIRRRETGVRVGSHAPFPGAATDLSVRQLGDLFARIAPRRDGILVPMGKSSRADGKNSPGHGNGAVAGVKTSVSLRFQSKSVVKQADSG